MHPPQTPSLLGLPREIRDQIYSNLFRCNAPLQLPTECETGLRSTCHQLRAESSEFLFGKNQITLREDIRVIERCLIAILDHQAQYIRTLQLQLHFLESSRDLEDPNKQASNPMYHSVQPREKEVRQVLRLLQRLPLLRVLEIEPYGPDYFIDMLEPMHNLYQGLMFLSKKPSLKGARITLKIQVSGIYKVYYTRALCYILGRQPLAEEYPCAEKDYLIIRNFD